MSVPVLRMYRKFQDSSVAVAVTDAENDEVCVSVMNTTTGDIYLLMTIPASLGQKAFDTIAGHIERFECAECVAERLDATKLFSDWFNPIVESTTE